MNQVPCGARIQILLFAAGGCLGAGSRALHTGPCSGGSRRVSKAPFSKDLPLFFTVCPETKFVEEVLSCISQDLRIFLKGFKSMQMFFLTGHG